MYLTLSPILILIFSSGNSTKPVAQANPLVKPEPSDLKISTLSPANLARRNSRRPDFLDFSKAAET